MGGLTNRSRTRMEHEDRSREPSVRRAPSRFVRRPGNPECGFARRPTFLFLPRSFGLLLVALSAFSPPFLGQESRKESGRCMHSDVVVDSGHELACLSLFFSLSPHPLAYQLASPRCSVRDIKSNFPPLLLHEKLQTFFFFLRAKNEETSSPLLPNWPKPRWWCSRLLPPLHNSSRIPKRNHSTDSSQNIKWSDSFPLQFLRQTQFQRHSSILELIFSTKEGISLVPFKNPRVF